MKTMQDEKQYEQLLLQYQQLKNGAEDISRMIDNEDFDSAITMINSREKLYLSCKTMRRYLDLTPVQQKEADAIFDELRNMEMMNIKKLQKNMAIVQAELAKSQKVERIQQAYGDGNDSGNLINIQE